MLIDTRELTTGRQLNYDVCIVGAGAAGITLARALRSKRASVCLLESGGLNRIVRRSRSTTEGPQAPVSARLVISRFHDSDTLAAQPTTGLACVALSMRWTLRSGRGCRTAAGPSAERTWRNIIGGRPRSCSFSLSTSIGANLTSHAESLIPPDGALIGRIFRYSPPTRFGKAYRQELIESNAIDILLHANVMQLDVNEAGTAVDRVRVAALNKAPPYR